MDARRRAAGFTLIEVLIALSILAIAMTILYSTFATSAVTARVVDERADELSSLAGALDTLSHEVRGAYEAFSGRKRTITFTAMTPFQEDARPRVQTVSYGLEDGRLLRKVMPPGLDATAPRTFLLLEEVADLSFSFFDGTRWTDEWATSGRLPAGVRVTFSYKQRTVDTVIAVWSGGGRPT